MTTPLVVALTQVGVQEHPKGSNSGPEVDQYLKSIGLNPGYSWCMAFMFWCHQQAYGAKNQMLKTGGVLRQWNERPAFIVKGLPQPGDLFILEEGAGNGHTGMVESVAGTSIHTVEGNTNTDGSREGYEVCRRVRTIASCKGFMRFPPLGAK